MAIYFWFYFLVQLTICLCFPLIPACWKPQIPSLHSKKFACFRHYRLILPQISFQILPLVFLGLPLPRSIFKFASVFLHGTEQWSSAVVKGGGLKPPRMAMTAPRGLSKVSVENFAPFVNQLNFPQHIYFLSKCFDCHMGSRGLSLIALIARPRLYNL